jgi:hypothetical protein
MSGNEELQKWLSQLKKGAAREAGKTQHSSHVPPKRHKPAAKKINLPFNIEVEIENNDNEYEHQEVSEHIGEHRPSGMSATDIALARLREKEAESKLHAAREQEESRRNEAEERKKAKERIIAKQKDFEQRQKQFEEEESKRLKKHKSRGRRRRPASKAKNKKPSLLTPMENITKKPKVDYSTHDHSTKNIGKRLRHDPYAVREAFVLSEILSAPLAIRKDDHLWDR